MCVSPVGSIRVKLYYFHFQKEKAVSGNEKLMSLQRVHKRSRQMQKQFVHGAIIFSVLRVRKLPLSELLQNCILVVQSTIKPSTFRKHALV